MTSPHLLPDNILQRQICPECFKYLSVANTAINSSGETMCGRCLNKYGSNYNAKSYVESMYNIIAEGFSYKCINHYSGCSEFLGIAEMEEHEAKCNLYEENECLFCSYSGILSQLVNHCLKLHPENMSFDGKVNFPLTNMKFQKGIMFICGDNIFYITIGSTEDFITVKLSSLTKIPPSNMTRYGIKFYKSSDPSQVEYFQDGFGLLDVTGSKCFEKSKDELVSIFGDGVEICCEILVGNLSLEAESEFKHKFLKLSKLESDLNNLKQELITKENSLSEKTNILEQKESQGDSRYRDALNIIKNMSWNYKCFTCQTVSLTDIYWCPKKHVYCKTCLKNICKACDSLQEFQQIEEIGSFVVTCDWPECEEMICLKDYMKHKMSCLKRPYKCPLKKCNKQKVLSFQNLQEHWHSSLPALILDSSICCEINESKDCYWSINGDLYHLVMELDEEINILIEEIDVLSNNVTFACEGTNSNGVSITFSNFSGKSLKIPNFKQYYNSIKVFFVQ